MLTHKTINDLSQRANGGCKLKNLLMQIPKKKYQKHYF